MHSALIVSILLLAGPDAASAISKFPPPLVASQRQAEWAQLAHYEAPKTHSTPGNAKPAGAMPKTHSIPGNAKPASAMPKTYSLPGNAKPAGATWPWAGVGAWPSWAAGATPAVSDSPFQTSGVGAWPAGPTFWKHHALSQVPGAESPAGAKEPGAGEAGAEEAGAEEQAAEEQAESAGPPQGDDEFHILYNVEEWQATAPTFTKEEKVEFLGGTDPSDNLCINGSLVPEVFVIGAPKTGTTTFCEGLRYTPSARFPISTSHAIKDKTHPAFWKEGHYFDFNKKYGKALMSHDFRGQGDKVFANCPGTSRMFAVDGSARYSLDPTVPPLIAEWYVDQAPKLKFVYHIREPVNRLLSHYHHAYEQHWCMELNMMSFRTVAHRIMRGLAKEWVYSDDQTAAVDPAFVHCKDFVEGSLYTNHLRRYFKYFSPSQFLVIPFGFISKPGEVGKVHEQPSHFLWKKLGAKGLDVPFLHANKRHHKALDEVLSKSDQNDLRTWFHERTGPQKIAAMLVDTEAALWGYEKSPADGKAIADWIKTNWW